MLVVPTSVVGFEFRSGKLRTSKCLPIWPRNRTSDLCVGAQQGATLGADHLVWGGPQRNSHAADGARRTRVRAGGLPDFKLFRF